jgi:hypothetical protein
MPTIRPAGREVDVGRDHRSLRWLFLNRRTGRITIAQWPNIWLSVFLVASIVMRIVRPAGTAETVLQWLVRVALMLWALDEVLRGVNPFRRLLGLAVLVATVVEIASH